MTDQEYCALEQEYSLLDELRIKWRKTHPFEDLSNWPGFNRLLEVSNKLTKFNVIKED